MERHVGRVRTVEARAGNRHSHHQSLRNLSEKTSAATRHRNDREPAAWSAHAGKRATRLRMTVNGARNRRDTKQSRTPVGQERR